MVRHFLPESMMEPGPWQGILALTRAQIRRGHQVTVVCSKNPRVPPGADTDVPVRRVFGYGTHLFRTYALTYGISSLVEILRWARRGEVDVIHVHEQDTALIVMARRRGLKIPVAVHEHGLRRRFLADGMYRVWLQEGGLLQNTRLHIEKAADFLLERESRLGADVFFAISPLAKRDIIDHFGIPPEKIWVVYSGVDANRFRPMERPDWPSLPPGPRVFTAGGGDSRKGGHIFLQVARIFQREGWPGSFLMAGDVKEDLRKTASSNVRFLGLFPHPMMPLLHQQYDVYFEPFLSVTSSKSLAEAMACEKPVVSTLIADNADLVTPETGSLIPPEQPERMARVIHELLEDPDLCRRMGREGRRRILEKFTWDQVAERMEEGYRQVVG